MKRLYEFFFLVSQFTHGWDILHGTARGVLGVVLGVVLVVDIKNIAVV